MTDRAELIEAVASALWKLDGSTLTAVAFMTGLSVAEIRDLGGLDELE